MMSMKRGLSLLLVIILSVVVFAGCSQNGGNTSGPEPEKEVVTTPEPEPEPEVEWPTDAVSIICPTRAGGFMDAHSRILADYLQRSTGVPFAVVNASEGGGNIGSDSVRFAKPDGRTLLHFHTSFPISTFTGRYDANVKEDFTIIAGTQTGGYHVFATRPDAPYDNIEELVQYAKENPETVKWGASTGVTSHFMMGLLEREAGVKFKMLDAGNEGEKLLAMLGGNIDVGNFGINSAVQHEEAGNLKILGVIGPERDKNYPQYPTVREQGYDVSWSGAFGLYGPAGMDPELVRLINESLKGYGEDEKAQEALAKMNAGFTYMNVEESVEYYHDQLDMLEALAKDLGF